MKTKILVIILSCIPFIGIGQEQQKIKKMIQKIRANYHKIFIGALQAKKDSLQNTAKKENLTSLQKEDKTLIIKAFNEIDEIEAYFKSIEKIIDRNNLKGAIQFGLIGNESRNSNQYTIETGMEANYGIYPLQIKAKTNLQTQITNNNFNETLSVVNIAADYHPFKETFFENYAFIKRTRNVFLGVEQRYEVGGGMIFNFYSSNIDSKGNIKGTIPEGKKLLEELQQWQEKYPKKKLLNTHLYNCTKEFCKKEKIANEDEVASLFKEQDSYKKTIKKAYSKHRLAFLIGINTEIERTQNNLQLYNGENLIMQETFPATTIFRLVLAPKYDLKGANFSWKNTLYNKIRIAGDSDKIYNNSSVLINPNDQLIQSDKADFWIHYQSEFEFKLTNVISLTATLNYIYDNAPKRNYYQDNSNNSQLAIADQRYLGTSFKLKYTF